MHYHNSPIYHTMVNKNIFKLKILFMSILTGILSGLLVILYRVAIEMADKMRGKFYFNLLKSNIFSGIFLMIFIAILISLFLKIEPLISGSGIPQVRGLILRQIDQNWLKIIFLKFIGGVISIFAGLSLGREGPSIHLGASIGQGISSIYKNKSNKIEEKYLITAGASAGLAAAFNAPLAGVIFSLEEIHKNFSPVVLLSSMASAIAADFISKKFFGLKPVFHFNDITPLQLNYYFLLIIFGIILGFFGFLFNISLIKSLNSYSNLKKLPPFIKLLIPITCSALLLFIIPQVLGGGHLLIESIIEDNISLNFLVLLLISKFLFTMISYGSGAPGGIFLPLLAIGSIAGAIYAKILILYFGLNEIYLKNFVILGMAGYFTAIVRAPITGSILITEMTGSFSHLLALIIVSITSYVTAELLGSKPIYEQLLERLIVNKKDMSHFENNEKTLIEICVSTGSELERKMVREIKWPPNCLLVAIRRGDKEIIPKGSTIVYEGDYLILLTDEANAPYVKQYLLKLASSISAW
ncbi:chloride channel protein [Thermovenabulum sp.]|uniref:ClC family H(+)/Cl(-) exchange transporter n=1 Tax=Thermovenabulum sp. TaxID=3100335 RepID=UPI003C7B5B46